jgi:hypothetical protein
MASDYGLNFGFRRSHEGISVREGRQKTPATGPQLLQGTYVVLDDANPGYLKVAAAAQDPVTGVSGLLVQEEFDRSIYETSVIDSYYFGITKLNRLSVILSGAGTKFWLRNTIAASRADDRQIAAVTMFTGVPVQGGYLTWNGNGYACAAAGAAPAGALARITNTNGSDYLEAVLLG